MSWEKKIFNAQSRNCSEECELASNFSFHTNKFSSCLIYSWCSSKATWNFANAKKLVFAFYYFRYFLMTFLKMTFLFYYAEPVMPSTKACAKQATMDDMHAELFQKCNLSNRGLKPMLQRKIPDAEPEQKSIVQKIHEEFQAKVAARDLKRNWSIKNKYQMWNKIFWNKNKEKNEEILI